MEQVIEKKKNTRAQTVKTSRKTTTKKKKMTPVKKSPPKKNMHNKDLGARGEEVAVDFLKRRGFSILERNWTCFAGEADIIALDDEAIHFIEVKTRRGNGHGFPAEAVDAKKRRRYEAISELYLSTYDGCDTGVTFDIIAINVLENERAYVRVYRNVLSCDCR